MNIKSISKKFIITFFSLSVFACSTESGKNEAENIAKPTTIQYK